MNFANDYIQARAHCPVSDEPRVGMKYIVAIRDTLESIAFSAYGNSNYWRDVYSANITLIGNDPDIIITGMALYMPDIQINNDVWDPTYIGHQIYFKTARKVAVTSTGHSRPVTRAVVGVQVLPFITSKEQAGDKLVIECQLDGADKQTEGYGIYLRLNDGTVSHYDDEVSEHAAFLLAKKLCDENKVYLEPYPWQTNLFHILGPIPTTTPVVSAPEPAIPALVLKASHYGNYPNSKVYFVWNVVQADGTYSDVQNPKNLLEFPRDIWKLEPATFEEIQSLIITPAVNAHEKMVQDQLAKSPRPNFEYVTKDGDTFADIAVAAYNRASLAAIIVACNQDKDITSTHLPSNITLRIPPNPSDRNQAAAGHQYITKLGDTLESIAMMAYGDETTTRKIIDANSDNAFPIGNHAYLPKDMCLDIPDFAKREEKPTTYTTKLGESLKGAAMAIYGDANMWRALKVANHLAGGEAMADMPLAIDTVLQIPKQF